MDNERIQNFGDMVAATESLIKPWKWFCGFLLVALVFTNLIWGFAHFKQIQYAYLTPVEFEQAQQFDEHTQSQSYNEGVTNGK